MNATVVLGSSDLLRATLAMTTHSLPVLYSFRRCPYAMRARMALVSSGQRCELREVVLRDKPAEMLDASPKATVPVLIGVDGAVLEESLDIMHWALGRADPHQLLEPDVGTLDEMQELIERMDGPFKTHLDRYKYGSRRAEELAGTDADPIAHRDAGLALLDELEGRLEHHEFLFGARLSLADIAIAPFVRQFANTDADWFADQPYLRLQAWLDAILQSDLFLSCMVKYEQWKSPETGVQFPPV